MNGYIQKINMRSLNWMTTVMPSRSISPVIARIVDVSSSVEKYSYTLARGLNG